MTDKLREAAQQALEALESAVSDDQPYITQSKNAIAALRAALAEQEQDHAAYNGWVLREVLFDNGEPIGHRAQEPLTDDQIDSLYRSVWSTVAHGNRLVAFARAIERAHGIGETNIGAPEKHIDTSALIAALRERLGISE